MLSCTSEIWEKSASLLSISLIISATAVYAIVAVLGFSKTRRFGGTQKPQIRHNSSACFASAPFPSPFPYPFLFPSFPFLFPSFPFLSFTSFSLRFLSLLVPLLSFLRFSSEVGTRRVLRRGG